MVLKPKDTLLSDDVPSRGVTITILARFLDMHMIQTNRTSPDDAAALPPIKKQTSYRPMESLKNPERKTKMVSKLEKIIEGTIVP